MFTLVYGDDLLEFPKLATEMFQDRRAQFHDAHGWDLNIDALGREIDEYDLMNPLYVILRDEQGRHLASSRVMPTTGPTMIADHFSDMTDGVQIESPLIWETTRFFVADRKSDSMRNAAALMWAGCALALKSGIEFYTGVTAAHNEKVFAACGWRPEIIGERKDEKDGHLIACLWEVREDICARLRRMARLDIDTVDLRVYRPSPRREQITAKPETATDTGALPWVAGTQVTPTLTAVQMM